MGKELKGSSPATQPSPEPEKPVVVPQWRQEQAKRDAFAFLKYGLESAIQNNQIELEKLANEEVVNRKFDKIIVSNESNSALESRLQELFPLTQNNPPEPEPSSILEVPTPIESPAQSALAPAYTLEAQKPLFLRMAEKALKLVGLAK